MDDLTRTQELNPKGQLLLKKTYEMKVTEIEFETRFAHLFLGDLPLPVTKKVSSFIYPTQQKRSSKRQAPAPPKSKLRELGGINSYHLRTITDLGPILTQSATVLSNTSCNVNIVINPLTLQRSPKLKTFFSNAELDSNFKVLKNTPTPTEEGGTSRMSLRRNNIHCGDSAGDISPSVSHSYNFPVFLESAFEKSCVDNREQIHKESHNSGLFHNDGELGDPKEDDRYSTEFSCVASQEENAFFSLPPAGSPSAIQESSSQEQIQQSHEVGIYSLVQNDVCNRNGTSHLRCISPCVPRISQHTQEILSPDEEESLDCIPDNSSCATDIRLSMHSLRVSKFETEKHTLDNAGSSNSDSKKLSQAENQPKNMETDSYCITKQTSPLMCEEVDDGMSVSEIIQSSPNLLGIMANNLSIHSQEDMHEFSSHEKMKDCSEKKVPPPKPPRNRRGVFTAFCEADVPSLIKQDSFCNIGDVSDDETPLKPPRNKCKVRSYSKRPLNNPGDTGQIAVSDSKELNHKQEQQVVENLPPKRPERFHRRPVVDAVPQQRQSFRAKQHNTKKCRRKFSFPVKFSVSLKSSFDIFRMSRKHHTSKAPGERSCKKNSIPFKSWLYPKSSVLSDFENFHIPRIILHLEPSDAVRDDNLEVSKVIMNDQQHGKTSSVSTLIIPDPSSYDKGDLSTISSLKIINCSQSSLLFENKQISSSQSSQNNEEYQEHTGFMNKNLSSEKEYMLPSLVSDNVMFMNAYRYEEKDY